jgi:hypothetical protein
VRIKRKQLNKWYSCQTAGNWNITVFQMVYFFNTYSAQGFIWTHDVADCPGIPKIILAKGGHGLENIRLNLFRVFCRALFHTLKNVINNFFYFFGTNDWPTSTFFLSQSQFRETHQHNL